MTVLDHFAVGTAELSDGWDLFAGVLGGTWAYGTDSPGFWWGQLKFAAGPKVELLRPSGGPDAAFLERFLADRGAGPHHYNFITPDITAALGRIRDLGIEPVGVRLDNPGWKEAFLHPRSAYGIVIQVAQQAREPSFPAPPDLPEAGPAAAFDLIEHHVADLDGAVALFRDGLEGQVAGRDAGAADLTWPGGKRIRLVRASAGTVPPGSGGLHHVRFSRAEPFSPAEQDRAGLLAKRLGLTVELAAS
jgi:methylmalonyl-CoA/ethylmalonyl-CoA epimerase